MTPTTELRIEGTLRFPNMIQEMELNYDLLMYLKSKYGADASLSIVPKEDSTGMSLYKVEEVEEKDRLIDELGKNLLDIVKSKEANNREFLRVAAQLEQKEKEIERQKVNYKWLFNKGENLAREIIAKNSEIADKDLKIKTLETELRLKENTWWKTFIKWVKGIKIKFG